MGRNKDSLWKGMLEVVFEDLLRFIFPRADELFDMKRAFGFLDKELGELYPEPEKPSDTRYVDKLVQVYRHGGRPEWLLIHLEVQGRNKPEFPERMFRYYYRIFDRWRRPVTAIAIFTGADAHRVPNRYEHSFLGIKLLYQYNVLRIGDYTEEELSASNNPFAIVMLVAKKALLAGKIPETELVEQKLLVARALLANKVLSREKVRKILAFLNNYIVFKKPETNHVFKKQFDQITNKKNPMDILEMLAEDAKEEARLEERKKFVKALLKNSGFPMTKIASFVGVSVYFVRRVRNESRKEHSKAA